jgi:CO/xanthine dehydrogenase Mo-binding subunit
MTAIGQPISRADGRAKVTGGARYTADISISSAVHAAIVHSTIAAGRTVSIDTTAAEQAPGVLAVLTHRNMPRMKAVPWSHLRPQGQTYLPLQDNKIHYAGQPVVLVVAGTLDRAAYAGTLIEVEYEISGRPCSLRGSRKGDRAAAALAALSSVGDAEGDHGRCSQDRPSLHDAQPASQSDGAARDHGRLGR